jgi:hypothetical protein
LNESLAMLRRTLLALALLPALIAPALPVSAQQAPFVTLECSQSITGVGRRAAVARNAEQSAIDAWDAEARRIHGPRAGFTWRGGEQVGRTSLSCQRRAGLTSCEARGRSCIWRPSATATTEVPSICRQWWALDRSRSGAQHPCVGSTLGDVPPVTTGRGVQPPRANVLPSCPNGYGLDPANAGRCLRQ